MAKLILGSVLVQVVEEDGKVRLDLEEDSELARKLPLIGPFISDKLPAKETFNLPSAADALALFPSVVSHVRSLFAK